MIEKLKAKYNQPSVEELCNDITNHVNLLYLKCSFNNNIARDIFHIALLYDVACRINDDDYTYEDLVSYVARTFNLSFYATDLSLKRTSENIQKCDNVIIGDIIKYSTEKAWIAYCDKNAEKKEPIPNDDLVDTLYSDIAKKVNNAGISNPGLFPNQNAREIFEAALAYDIKSRLAGRDEYLAKELIAAIASENSLTYGGVRTSLRKTFQKLYGFEEIRMVADIQIFTQDSWVEYCKAIDNKPAEQQLITTLEKELRDAIYTNLQGGTDVLTDADDTILECMVAYDAAYRINTCILSKVLTFEQPYTYKKIYDYVSNFMEYQTTFMVSDLASNMLTLFNNLTALDIRTQEELDREDVTGVDLKGVIANKITIPILMKHAGDIIMLFDNGKKLDKLLTFNVSNIGE